MSKKYFKTFHEIEHEGDKRSAEFILRNAGAINIFVDECNYEAEYCVFGFELPDGMTVEQYRENYKKAYAERYEAED